MVIMRILAFTIINISLREAKQGWTSRSKVTTAQYKKHVPNHGKQQCLARQGAKSWAGLLPWQQMLIRRLHAPFTDLAATYLHRPPCQTEQILFSLYLHQVIAMIVLRIAP